MHTFGFGADRKNKPREIRRAKAAPTHRQTNIQEANSVNDEVFMKQAIELSPAGGGTRKRAAGAVLVKKTEKLCIRTKNQIYTMHDPSFHGEASADPAVLRGNRDYGLDGVYHVFKPRALL